MKTIEYGLDISSELKSRLDRCKVSVRTAIRDRLQEVASVAAQSPARPGETGRKQPPFCFYDFEGFRVSYQVDPDTRRVVVLDLGREAKA